MLDALDILFGPAHAGVIITSKGKMLVEISSRIGGGTDLQFNPTCPDNDQTELTQESYSGNGCCDRHRTGRLVI